MRVTSRVFKVSVSTYYDSILREYIVDGNGYSTPKLPGVLDSDKQFWSLRHREGVVCFRCEDLRMVTIETVSETRVLDGDNNSKP